MVEWNGCHVRNIYSTITKAGTDTTGCGIRGVGDPWGFYVKTKFVSKETFVQERNRQNFYCL